MPEAVVPKPALVLMLHGHGGTGDGMRRYKDFAIASGDGAVVVYPDGVNHGWNDGRDDRNTADDIGFLHALIAKVQSQYHTDAKRVYVAGMSNGAMMGLRVACQMNEVTAVAAVAGGMPVRWKSDCRPAHPVSVLAIEGTADPLVPFNGGGVYGGKHGFVLSAGATIGMFRTIDRCGARFPMGTPTPVAPDGTMADFQIWTACATGSAVVLATVQGGGHGWPGGGQNFPMRLVGIVSQSFDASTYIWEFFKGHAL